MIGLVRIALRRPYTSAIASLLILLMGALSINRMIVDIFPVIDIPVVLVVWSCPGLTSEDMERRVVFISEPAYSTTVDGISRIESQSIPGSFVSVTIHVPLTGYPEVPAEGLVVRGNTIYIADRDAHSPVHLRPVTVASSDGITASLATGASVGTRIVMSLRSDVSDGSRVRPATSVGN